MGLEIDKLFQKEINKFKSMKDYFRDSIRRQLNNSSSWQLDILKDELEKEYSNRGDICDINIKRDRNL
jgi:hypothetical protein